MSCSNSLKIIIPAFAIAILVLSLSSPALATPAVKAQPPAVTTGGQASPVVSPLPAGNGALNGTPGAPTLPGHGKFGNLHTPPAIVKNLTQKVKKQVNDVRLNQAIKIAEGKINLIIGQLQLYEKWVANSRLSNDQKSGIKVIVDSNIAWFRQQYEDIGAADDLTTIQTLADQADQQAATLKVSIKKEAGILACDGLDGRIATARNASAGIAYRIALLKARGNDTVAVENKLADYNAHVNAAGTYSLAARAAFEGITSADNTDSGFNEGYRQIRLADREMTQAYADLREVYRWYLQNTRAQR
jgi:hypothetical protein